MIRFLFGLAFAGALPAAPALAATAPVPQDSADATS